MCVFAHVRRTDSPSGWCEVIGHTAMGTARELVPPQQVGRPPPLTLTRHCTEDRPWKAGLRPPNRSGSSTGDIQGVGLGLKQELGGDNGVQSLVNRENLQGLEEAGGGDRNGWNH